MNKQNNDANDQVKESSDIIQNNFNKLLSTVPDKTKGSSNHSNSFQLSFEHLSKMLTSLNIISSHLTNEHRNCLEYPSIDFYIKKSDDNDQSANDNILSIKSTVSSCELKIDSLYKLYKSLGQRELYPLEDFRVLIQIFTSILAAFNDTLFQYDLEKDIFSPESHRLNIFKITDTKANQSYQENIDTMYKYLSEIPDIPSKNILYLLCVFSLFGDISHQSFNFDTFLRNVGVYNMVILSDFKLHLLIHFHIVILVNITLKKVSTDKSLSSIKKKKGERSPCDVIPPLFFIDNFSFDHTMEPSFQNILMSTIVKMHLLPYLEASPINCYFNLNILSYESIRWVSGNLSAMENQIKMNKEILLNTGQFIDLIDAFDINEFNIIFDHSFTPSAVSGILSSYLPIILYAKSFNADTEIVEKPLMLSFKNYIAELEMIIEVLKFNLKVKTAKNKKSSSSNFVFCFSFNSFSITTKKDLSIKDKHIRSMMIFLNQKNFNEEDLVNHLSKRGSMPSFYNDIRKIFNELLYFKKYSINIRLTQQKIVNEQLKYYFGIIYLQVQHYLSEHSNSYRNVVLYETESITPQTTIVINNSLKQKEKFSHYMKYVKRFELGFIVILNQYINTLIDCFADIVIHYVTDMKLKFNPRILLRSFSENILIIITDAIYIDLIIYMHENDYSKEYHENIMDWIQTIRINPETTDLIRDIIVVMNKQCLRDKDYYNTDANLKRFLSDVSVLYLMDKEYDLVLQERRMFIYNRKTDANMNQIETFFNYVKSCYDTIQYVLDNQLRPYDNFGFVTQKYLIQFKIGCMSIRKMTVKSFDSLFVIHPFDSSNSYPVVNIMTGKSSKDFSIVNLLKLFKNHFVKMEQMDQDLIIEILHKHILSRIYHNTTLLILKLKFYENIKRLLPFAKFNRMIVFPIKLNKVDLNLVNPICKEVTLFQFENSRLNFHSSNDMGHMFSLNKTEKTLEALTTNATSHTMSQRGKIRDYLLSITWALRHRIKGREIDKCLITICNFLINKNSIQEDGICELYSLDFIIVGNEVKKYKKNIKYLIEESNSNVINEFDVNQGVPRKRKVSDSTHDTDIKNNINHNNLKYKASSGYFDTKRSNKNCIIF